MPDSDPNVSVLLGSGHPNPNPNPNSNPTTDTLGNESGKPRKLHNAFGKHGRYRVPWLHATERTPRQEVQDSTSADAFYPTRDEIAAVMRYSTQDSIPWRMFQAQFEETK